ncbi:MAG: DUF3149 domain-containing protein [Burkholderiales bacterium PBB5]|nr:MAG: DUF3149 domain-containing protein [Burkholderiales bacterium PBB5]
MHALRDFFTSEYGLLSAAVIAFTLGMGAFFARYISSHIREDAARAAREAAGR